MHIHCSTCIVPLLVIWKYMNTHAHTHTHTHTHTHRKCHSSLPLPRQMEVNTYDSALLKQYQWSQLCRQNKEHVLCRCHTDRPDPGRQAPPAHPAGGLQRDGEPVEGGVCQCIISYPFRAAGSEAGGWGDCVAGRERRGRRPGEKCR